MSIAVRRAAPSDSRVLTEIAHAAKRHWGYPEGWIALWSEALTMTPEFVAANEVYVATEGDEALGFYTLLLSGDRALLEHMWVHPVGIGTGIGRTLFNHAVRTASTFNAAEMEIESDPNAEGFDLRMGARRVGEVVSEIEGQTRALPRLILDVARFEPARSRREGSASS
jgi:GNAT superfamily N-acetyltransferase